MNKLSTINKNILLNRNIPDSIIKPFPGYSLNMGLIIFLRDKINLFHNFLISPFAFLNGHILNVVLVVNVFSGVRLIGFASLGLERGGL